MAGVANKQGRRLRGRDVAAAPAVTRSAAQAAAAAANGAGHIENPRRSNKAAAKRVAVDDHSLTASARSAQHANKRAVLADLTNCPTTSSDLNSNIQASRSQAAVQAAGAKGKIRRDSQRKGLDAASAHCIESFFKSHGEARSGWTSETQSSVTFQNDKNQCPGGSAASLKIQYEALDAGKSRCNRSRAVLSQPTKPQASQVHVVEELFVEGEGWSGRTHTDIDVHRDPQMCSSYAADIYNHLRIAELKRRPAADAMEVFQQDITGSMRGILVDWLVEVAEEYKLVPDTLYLTVSYLDRFLSGNLVNRQQLQLLGVSCMLIASKYEEICAPQVEEFCYITDNTYGRDEVLEMERQVLNYLHFDVSGPTTKTFLRRFVRAAQAGQKTPTLKLEYLGNYLAELTLAECSFLKYLPSMIAASAVFLAKVTLDSLSNPWNSTLQHYSGYKPSEMKDCVNAIHALHRNTKHSTLIAVRQKYRQHKFKCVAALAPPPLVPFEYFDDLG